MDHRFATPWSEKRPVEVRGAARSRAVGRPIETNSAMIAFGLSEAPTWPGSTYSSSGSQVPAAMAQQQIQPGPDSLGRYCDALHGIRKASDGMRRSVLNC